MIFHQPRHLKHAKKLANKIINSKEANCVTVGTLEMLLQVIEYYEKKKCLTCSHWDGNNDGHDRGSGDFFCPVNKKWTFPDGYCNDHKNMVL